MWKKPPPPRRNNFLESGSQRVLVTKTAETNVMSIMCYAKLSKLAVALYLRYRHKCGLNFYNMADIISIISSSRFNFAFSPNLSKGYTCISLPFSFLVYCTIVSYFPQNSQMALCSLKDMQIRLACCCIALKCVWFFVLFTFSCIYFNMLSRPRPMVVKAILSSLRLQSQQEWSCSLRWVSVDQNSAEHWRYEHLKVVPRFYFF